MVGAALVMLMTPGLALFYGPLLGQQTLAAIATMAERFIGFRIAAEDEIAGIDLAKNAESAYEFTDASAGSFAGVGTTHQAHGIHRPDAPQRSEQQ